MTRLIVCSKSLALTALPSEYFRPLRSFSLYVLPPFETSGIASARPGISCAPVAPASRL
jgi:hypothetical protein